MAVRGSQGALIAVGLALVVVAVAGLAGGQPAPAASGIHVAHGHDPAGQAIVAWMAPPDADTHVEYGAEAPEQTVDGEASPAAGSEKVPYRATLTGLEPGTTYVYRVVVAGQASEEHTFATAPAPEENETVRITAFADHGTATEANRADGEAPVRNVELAASLEPDVHLLAGDLSYAEGRAEQWNRYVEQIQPLAAEVPFMTVPGNHEREPATPDSRAVPAEAEPDEEAQGFHQYDARFAMPTPGAEDERWWAIQRGNVFVVGLNTERACQASFQQHGTPNDSAGNCEFFPEAPHEPQLSFFEQAVAQAAEDPTVDWTIVLAHHAFWSSGGHGSTEGLQEHYMPAIDEHGVDLVVQGHDHLYERSHLLREGEVAEEGTLYVTNGAGGSGFYEWDGEQPAWSAARDNEHYGTLVLDLAEDELNGRFVSLDGETIDAFTFANAEEGLRAPAPSGNETGTSTTSGDDDGVLPVPTPGAFALLAVAGLLAARARRRAAG